MSESAVSDAFSNQESCDAKTCVRQLNFKYLAT